MVLYARHVPQTITGECCIHHSCVRLKARAQKLKQKYVCTKEATMACMSDRSVSRLSDVQSGGVQCGPSIQHAHQLCSKPVPIPNNAARAAAVAKAAAAHGRPQNGNACCRKSKERLTLLHKRTCCVGFRWSNAPATVTCTSHACHHVSNTH